MLGELALDGTITSVAGVLPAAIAANARGHGLICPAACGAEAAWAGGDFDVLAPRSLIQLANHFKGTQVLPRPSRPSRRSRPPARSQGHQRPGKRQADPRDRRRRRSSPADVVD